MRADPRMIQIRCRASPRVMKSKHRAAMVIHIRIETRQISSGVHFARQSFHAAVVALPAAAKPGVERATRSVRQCPKVVVERVVFLHDDDYVLDLVQVTIAKRLPWHERHEHESRQQSASQNPEPSHSSASSITAGVFGPRPGTLLSLSYRSEEHTSELQSRLHLVCRLLLEKKKNKHI